MSLGNWIDRLGMILLVGLLASPCMVEIKNLHAATPMCDQLDAEMADVVKTSNGYAALRDRAIAENWDYDKFQTELINYLGGGGGGGGGTTYSNPMFTQPYGCGITLTPDGEALIKANGEYGEVLRNIFSTHEQVHSACCKQKLSDIRTHSGDGQTYQQQMSKAANYTTEEMNAYCRELQSLLGTYKSNGCGAPKPEYTCKFDDTYCAKQGSGSTVTSNQEKSIWDTILDWF